MKDLVEKAQKASNKNRDESTLFFEKTTRIGVLAEEYERLRQPALIGLNRIKTLYGWVKHAAKNLPDSYPGKWAADKLADPSINVEKEVHTWLEHQPYNAELAILQEIIRIGRSFEPFIYTANPDGVPLLVTDTHRSAAESLAKIAETTRAIVPLMASLRPDGVTPGQVIMLFESSISLGLNICKAHVEPMEILAQTYYDRSKKGDQSPREVADNLREREVARQMAADYWRENPNASTSKIANHIIDIKKYSYTRTHIHGWINDLKPKK